MPAWVLIMKPATQSTLMLAVSSKDRSTSRYTRKRPALVTSSSRVAASSTYGPLAAMLKNSNTAIAIITIACTKGTGDSPLRTGKSSQTRNEVEGVIRSEGLEEERGDEKGPSD